jgi:hypothetical protein
MSIVNECMVINLQVGLWLGYRLDKAASLAVTEQANADQDAARVNKHLVPKETLKPIVSAAGAIRTHFYDKTLPWKDNGDRLLTRKMYTKFIEEHSKLVSEFDNAVDDFLSNSYLKAKDQAEFRMGDLFNSSDYPDSTTLRNKFYVNLDIDSVTQANDFRVQLDANELERVKAQMMESTQARLGRAMQDVWQRLADTLKHFGDKMSKDEIFRDSTVRNLEEIVELLPDLNILNDPQLEQVRQDIKNSLIGYDPKDLRKDKAVRNNVASEAQRIMDTMSGFMNAFGGAS